ncbi:hypothetical protein [Arthrobacter sp. NPDC090010]|uniref:hypothetical protein n=1 Tax=Arthrobacter sp. NPDC090010 TaxID=3363942 RepID=UPI003803F5E9
MKGHSKPQRHREALPPRAVVTSGVVLSLLHAGVLGSVAALGLLLVVMLVASLSFSAGTGPVALGVLATSSAGIVFLGLLWGLCAVPERLARARFYSEFAPRS